jgi:hypothetical protein
MSFGDGGEFPDTPCLDAVDIGIDEDPDEGEYHDGR